MSKLLAVDGSSIFMRALSVLPEDKRTVDDLEYLTVSMLRKAARITQATHMVVALDTTDLCWRYNLHPGYKGSRNYSDLRPKQLTPMILPRLKARRIATAYHDQMEADDLLCTLSASIRPGHEMVCYTRDSDLLCLTYMDGVTLLWPENGGNLLGIDHLAAEARLGHPPEWLALVRALTADAKDDLRTLFETPKGWRCPLTKPRAIELLKLYEADLMALLDAAVRGDGAGMKPKEQEYLCLNAEHIAVTWHVATLRRDAALGVEATETQVRNMDLTVPRRDEE